MKRITSLASAGARRLTAVWTPYDLFPLGGFNLLPHRYRRARRRRRRCLYEALFAAFAGLALASAIGYGKSRRAAHERLRERTLEHKLANLQPVQALSEQLNALAQQQAQRAAAIDALRPRRCALWFLLTGLARTRTPGITLTGLEYETLASTVSGSALDQTALRRWVRRLKHSNWLSSVEVTQMQRGTNPPAGHGKQYATPAAANIAFSLRLVFAAPQRRADARTRRGQSKVVRADS